MKIKDLWWSDGSLFVENFDNSITKYEGAYIKEVNTFFDKDDTIIQSARIVLDSNPILVSELFNRK
jgi:hypothetical protein